MDQPLGAAFADFVGVRPGQRVLDVGSGPGALTVELVRRLGEESVSAVDPSPPFVAGLAERLPGVDVRSASAEEGHRKAGTPRLKPYTFADGTPREMAVNASAAPTTTG